MQMSSESVLTPAVQATVQATIKAALEITDEFCMTLWSKPPRAPPHVPENSKPLFVALDGKQHRTCMGLAVAQYTKTPLVDFPRNGGRRIDLGFNREPMTEKKVFEFVRDKIASEDGDDTHCVFFPIVYERDAATTKTEKIECTVTMLTLSKAELAALCAHEREDTHAVFIVVQPGGSVADMSTSNLKPFEPYTAGPSRRQAVMAVTWERLRALRDDKDAIVVGDADPA